MLMLHRMRENTGNKGMLHAANWENAQKRAGFVRISGEETDIFFPWPSCPIFAYRPTDQG